MELMLPPSKDATGSLRLERGDLADRRYGVEISICSSPVCQCERVMLRCFPEQSLQASVPLCLEMDLEQCEITSDVPVAAAKSTKIVAVLDVKIVAARCPIPWTMNLNCIQCPIAPHGPATSTPVNHQVSIKLGYDRTTYSSSRLPPQPLDIACASNGPW